jgi:hypothetical protein
MTKQEMFAEFIRLFPTPEALERGMDECKEVLAEKGILYTKTGKGKKTRVNLKLIDKGQEKV